MTTTPGGFSSNISSSAIRLRKDNSGSEWTLSTWRIFNGTPAFRPTTWDNHRKQSSPFWSFEELGFNESHSFPAKDQRQNSHWRSLRSLLSRKATFSGTGSVLCHDWYNSSYRLYAFAWFVDRGFMFRGPFLGAATFTIAITGSSGAPWMGHKLTANRNGIEATPPISFLTTANQRNPRHRNFGSNMQNLWHQRRRLVWRGFPAVPNRFRVGASGDCSRLDFSPIFPSTGKRAGLPIPLVFEIIAIFFIKIPANHYVLLHPVAFAGWVRHDRHNVELAACGNAWWRARCTFDSSETKPRMVLTFLSILMLIVRKTSANGDSGAFHVDGKASWTFGRCFSSFTTETLGCRTGCGVLLCSFLQYFVYFSCNYSIFSRMLQCCSVLLFKRLSAKVIKYYGC